LIETNALPLSRINTQDLWARFMTIEQIYLGERSWPADCCYHFHPQNSHIHFILLYAKYAQVRTRQNKMLSSALCHA